MQVEEGRSNYIRSKKILIALSHRRLGEHFNNGCTSGRGPVSDSGRVSPPPAKGEIFQFNFFFLPPSEGPTITTQNGNTPPTPLFMTLTSSSFQSFKT